MLPGETKLSQSIERTRDALSRRVRVDNGQPLPADFDIVAFERTMDNTPADHASMQRVQSQAHALGRIPTAEAQVIYIALGEVPAEDGWAAGTDLATKIVVTQALSELLGRSR